MAEQLETLPDEEKPLLHDLRELMAERKRKSPKIIGYPAITPEGEGVDPIEAAKRIPAEFRKTVEDVQTELAKQAEEKRLKEEQEERTRLRNVGQMGDPTDLVYRRSDGSTRTIQADVDLRYAFGDDVQKFDVSRTSVRNPQTNRPEALFSFILPRTPDGKVGNPDGSRYTLHHFMRERVMPFVNNHLGIDIKRMHNSGGQKGKKLATEILYKATLDILKNNGKVLNYFTKNDPENMNDFLDTLETEGVVVAETKYGKQFRLGEKPRYGVQREIDITVPSDPISLAGRIEKTFKVPYWMAGSDKVTINDPFYKKQLDDIVKLDEQRTFWKRGINWHLINFGALSAEMAAGAVSENARARSLTEFATNWGPILNLTPKKLGQMGNWMVRNTFGLGKLMGYREFSEEELNRSDLTFTDITDATPISVQDSIMTAIATQMPSVFGHTPEDTAALKEIREVTGIRDAQLTKPGYAARFDPETGQIEAEGRPEDISDYVGFGISLFGINAAATRGLAMGARKSLDQRKLSQSWQTAARQPTPAGKVPLGKAPIIEPREAPWQKRRLFEQPSILKDPKGRDIPSVYKSDGTFDKAELAKLMRALDEGHDIAGLGILNLRVPFPGGKKKHFFRDTIMNATNHPFQQAGYLQLALAASIGGVEILNESLINEDGRYMNPLNPNEELNPRIVLGLNMLAGLNPILTLPIGTAVLKTGYNKTLAAAFMELTDPETYKLIQQIRDRAPEVNFSQASRFVRLQLQAYSRMREQFPDQAAILWEAFDELNSGGVKYAEIMRRVGASEKEIQEQLTAFRQITAHVWAFGSLAAAVTHFSTVRGLTTIRGGFGTRKMQQAAKDAQDQALLMANQHMASLSIAKAFSTLVKSLEDQQVRSAKEAGVGHNIDAVGINDAIIKYQKMMADVLETTVGGVNPKELSKAMVKLFRVTDDFNRGAIDLTEARDTIRSAVDGLTDIQDQQIFLQNVFLSREGKLLGDLDKFDKIMDDALPELREAIDKSNMAAAEIKTLVSSSVTFADDFPVRPPTNADEQHALVKKAFEEVKKLSDANWKELFDGLPGPQEKEFDITPLIEMMDELAKANEHGPISTGKLGGLIRQVQKMNPDTNIAVQLARSDVPDEGDFPLEVLLERGRTGGEGLSLTFQQYHALRSDVNKQLMAEFKKGQPDGGYINLLQRISHAMDDAIEVKLQQDPDAAARFSDANDFWRDHVAAPFFNNKALAMAHGEQFHGLFNKLFSRDGIDGQRQTFDRMFPEQKDGVDNPDRPRALELLREAMIREVIGDRPSMNTDEFFFALRAKASKENPGMFSAPTVDADGNITGGGFLDVLMGSVEGATKFEQLNIFAPNINERGLINTLAPNIHIGASVEKAFGSLHFAAPQKTFIEIQDGVLDTLIHNAALQINNVRVNKINDLTKGFWDKLQRQDNQSPDFTGETLNWILGSSRDHDGKVSAQVYKALFDDMKTLVGESEALAYQEYINRALIKDLHNSYMEITKAVSPSDLRDPDARVALKENMTNRKEYFIRYKPLFNEALGGDTEAVGYLIDMVSMAEQAPISIIKFAEQVNQFTANGALSRAWGVARNVVSPRYVISEWFLRSMLKNKSEVLVKMLSTPDLAPYLMDAVRVGQTPYKVQFFYKTQLMGAMIAGENDVDKIDEIQENIETWFKQSQENGDDFIQHTLSMYFAAQNPQIAREILHEMDQRKQGKPSNLLEIMQRQLSTPRGVQERLRPRQTRNPLTQALGQTLGLGNE